MRSRRFIASLRENFAALHGDRASGNRERVQRPQKAFKPTKAPPMYGASELRRPAACNSRWGKRSVAPQPTRPRHGRRDKCKAPPPGRLTD